MGREERFPRASGKAASLLLPESVWMQPCLVPWCCPVRMCSPKSLQLSGHHSEDTETQVDRLEPPSYVRKLLTCCTARLHFPYWQLGASRQIHPDTDGQWDIGRRFPAGTWAFRVGLKLRLESEAEKEL